MSMIFTHAAEQWRDMHREYQAHIDAQYGQAIEQCAGVLVNTLGRSKRIDGYTLMTGQGSRARKYASEELLNYWAKHPRITLAEFESLWFTGQINYRVAA